MNNLNFYSHKFYSFINELREAYLSLYKIISNAKNYIFLFHDVEVVVLINH